MKYIDSLDAKDKLVFLRVDFNVPLDSSRNIRSDARIQASLPTIHQLLNQGAKVIVASHLGRPKGKVVSELSMKPVAERLQALVSCPVQLAPAVTGPEVDQLKKSLEAGSILVLENLRFDSGEKTNDPAFAKELAQGIDIYVNDAFGACHRAHASIVGIAALVPQRAAGFLIKKELEYLNRIVKCADKPFVAILGGAKVSDKIPVVRNLLDKANALLIGGAMAYTFFSAQGKNVGHSLVDEANLKTAFDMLKSAEEKNIPMKLPIDHVIASSIDRPFHVRTLSGFPIPEGMMAVDIGPQTVKNFNEAISQAQTIFWNGPMGVFEVKEFSKGTSEIAKAVAASPGFSFVGGGDSSAAVSELGLNTGISHISTGGGASLEYIAKETLPGLEALQESTNANQQ